MGTYPAQKESLYLLESSLVREFRTAQALLRLVREEQSSLACGDAARLFVLAEHKEGLLDRLSGLEAIRRALLNEISVQFGVTSNGEPVLPEAVRVALEAETAARLERLLEGIQVVSAEVRSLAQANRQLAAIALKRSNDLQVGLLTAAPAASLPALCAAIMDARGALDEPKAGANPPAGETGLLEAIAGLYRQEKAYQAVMKMSSRMIAGM